MNNTDINQCIQTLSERPKWFFQKEHIAEKMLCFDTIQKLGTPATIHSLTRFLKSDNVSIQKKSAETILHLFAKLKSQNDYGDSLKHLMINKSDLDIYKDNFEENTYIQLLCIASLNSSGYVREKAINEMARLKNTNGLKFILFRLGDWVLPVRKAAAEGLNSFLNTTYIDQLLQEISTIEWLLHVKRADLTATHNRIIQFILTQEFSDEFRFKINRLKDKTRFQYFKHFFKHKKPGKEQIKNISKDKNFLIRLEVLKHLSIFDRAFQEELIGDFLQDQSTRIRVNALYAAKPFHPNFDKRINIMLSDESASVRDLCRYMLKTKSSDFPNIYRERIKKEEFLPGSLMGLSETGTTEDLLLFEYYINSGNSKIIIGCLTAINKLDPGKATILSVGFLTHSLKRVRNKAAEILAKGCDNNTLEKARQTYLAGNFEIKKTVLKLYNKIGGWYVIGDFLNALTDENNDIQNIGWQLLGKWKVNATRLFTTPPPTEIDKVNTIYKNLDRSKINLTHSRTNLLQDLLFYLR